MKHIWNKKYAMLIAGFALLVAMPFLILDNTPPSLQVQKDDTINPYPEPKDIAAAYIHKASENYFYREFAQAAENYHKALAIYEDRKDMHHVATTYNDLGDLYVWAGEPEEAEKNYLIAAEVHSGIDDSMGQAGSLKDLADLHVNRKDFGKAEERYSQSLKLLVNGKPNRVLGSIHESMGHMYWKTERIPQAIESFTHARETYAALNYHMGVEHMTNVVHRLKNVPKSQHPHAPREELPKEGYTIH